MRNQKQMEAKDRSENKTDADIEQIFDEYELLEDMASELDHLNEDEINDETLAKLISGNLKVSDSKKRVAHEEPLDVKSTYILQKYEKNEDNVTKPAPIEESKVDKKKEKKRRVRFSSTEDIQVITPASEIVQEQPPPTIQINFHHSEGKFHPDPPQVSHSEGDVNAPKFAHPGQFMEYVQSLASPKSPVTKSILKSKGGKKKSVNFQQPSPRDEEEHDEFESFLRQQVVIGDVIEHKNEQPVEVQSDSTKKVSKFKEMRSKVK